jgi:hypothetical protein
VQAAIVPVGTLTIVDKSGAGTFRYTARAQNSSGASAETAATSVTVVR